MASSALSPGCVLWNLLGDNEVTQRPTPERIEEIREALKGEGDFPFGVQASVARDLLAEIDALTERVNFWGDEYQKENLRRLSFESERDALKANLDALRVENARLNAKPGSFLDHLIETGRA